MSISSLINANTHRVKEGARVLEDIARFVLRDDVLFKNSRAIRHALLTIPPTDSAETDLGGQEFKEENVRSNLTDLVQANTIRIQEALRVLEEISVEANEKHKMKTLRFSAYELQQVFYQAIQRFLKHNKLKGLYLVIDPDVIQLPLSQIIVTINKSNVNIIQFRSKSLDKRSFFNQAIEIKSQLASNKLLIVNDHIDVALDVADGIHLGQTDYPLERIRKLIPVDFIFGVSCHSVAEATLAESLGASYVSVGCIFPTKSKNDTTLTSLETLSVIKQYVNIPICTIGGINPANISQLSHLNIDMYALISYVWQQSDPLEVIETISKSFAT